VFGPFRGHNVGTFVCAPCGLQGAHSSSVTTDPDDVEARSLLAFSAAIGHHFIAADHGDRSRADVLELATRRLFA
jgi:hypothetical protein